MNNSIDLPTPTKAPGAHIVEVWSTLVLQTGICIIGAVLNILNVLVFRNRRLEATPYLYMTALAVADTGTLLVHMPYGLARCDRRVALCSTRHAKQLRSILSYYLTYVAFEFGNIFESISAWITCLVCIERYVTIRWTHLGKLKFSRTQGKWQISIIFYLALFFHLPMFFVLEIKQRETVNAYNVTRRYQDTVLTTFGKSDYYYGYTWIRFILVQCVPLILLCVVNLLLLIMIWSSYHNQKSYQDKHTATHRVLLSTMREHRIEIERQSVAIRVNDKNPDESPTEVDNPLSLSKPSIVDDTPIRQIQSKVNRKQQANNKLTILLVAVVCLFLIGQIPQAIAYAHIIKLVTPADCQHCTAYVSLYQHFSHLLCLITSTANFFLYVGLNRHFRECLHSLCCRS